MQSFAASGIVHNPGLVSDQEKIKMATRGRKKKEEEKRREEEEKQKEEEKRKEAEAEEFLDERRVADGKERFWSQTPEVMLRVLASEENIKNSQEGQRWNRRYLLEAKAELEKREEWKRRVEEMKKMNEEMRGRSGVEEMKRGGRRERRGRQGTDFVRPALKELDTAEESNARLLDDKGSAPLIYESSSESDVVELDMREGCELEKPPFETAYDYESSSDGEEAEFEEERKRRVPFEIYENSSSDDERGLFED